MRANTNKPCVAAIPIAHGRDLELYSPAAVAAWRIAARRYGPDLSDQTLLHTLEGLDSSDWAITETTGEGSANKRVVTRRFARQVRQRQRER